MLESMARPSAPGNSPRTRVLEGTLFRAPKAEPVRINGRHTLTFPGQEVTKLSQSGNGQWQLQAGFIELAGAMGPLPFHYTELLLDRQKSKDQALAAFLDLFTHRSASLFWRASTKYRLPLEFERAQRHDRNNTVDKHTEMFLSLLGLSPRIFQSPNSVGHKSLIFYGGIFSQSIRTSANLKQLLADYFDVPVQVKEFSGAWSEVLPSMLCQLPSLTRPQGQNNCLGRTAMAGNQSWLAQNKVDIVVGPLSQKQYNQFSPGSQRLSSMKELASLYLGMENQCDFYIEIEHTEMPDNLKLGGDRETSLGWNTRLPKTGTDEYVSSTLTIPISNTQH